MVDLRSLAPHCALCIVNAAEAVEVCMCVACQKQVRLPTTHLLWLQVLSAGYILSQVTTTLTNSRQSLRQSFSGCSSAAS